MTELRLLASAPTLADIMTAITKFYGSPKTLVPSNGTIWYLVDANGLTIEGIRVRLLRYRYRLEIISA